MQRKLIVIRQKPFGCSIVCIIGFPYYDPTAINKELEIQEAQSEADQLVGIMMCSVVETYQKAVIPILEERGWEMATRYYSNYAHDYHPISIWIKRFDRRPTTRQMKDAEAGISILLQEKE